MTFIFKTNVSTLDDLRTLRTQLDQHLQRARWNFDLDDCDKVLRIDSPVDITPLAIRLLNDNGYACEELID